MNLRTTLAASSLALAALAFGPQAIAQQQPVQGGSSGGVQGQDVRASTYGTGYTDGTAIGVGGGGEAEAVDGSAETRSRARLNNRRAMQTSDARAQDDDERARSRTRTVVRDGEVRSRTTSRHHVQGGGAPTRETIYTVTNADGTTTTTNSQPRGRRNR